MNKILDEIKLQLDLPIGYQGRSYEYAVMDFRNLLKRFETEVKRNCGGEMMDEAYTCPQCGADMEQFWWDGDTYQFGYYILECPECGRQEKKSDMEIE